jgi:hypothetical protein
LRIGSASFALPVKKLRLPFNSPHGAGQTCRSIPDEQPKIFFQYFQGMIQAGRILDHLISSDKTPSVHYIHFTSEQLIYEYCKGLANIKDGIQITDRSVFHACSVTKTFTALAILQLEREGKLSIKSMQKLIGQGFHTRAT